jgi:hypothetical protein
MSKWLCVLTVCVVASLAPAVLITNVTDGTVLFKDTFESVPGEWVFPVAEVGTWTDEPGDDRVTANNEPPPCQGIKQLRIISNGSGVYGSVDGGVANATGNAIQVTLAVRPSTTYNQVFLYGTSPANRNTDLGSYGIGYIQIIGSAGVPGWGTIYEVPNKAYIYVGGSGYVLLGDIIPNAWNTVVIDYVNDAGTYSASINGGTAISGNTAWATGIVQGIGLTNNDSGTSCWDAAPPMVTGKIALGNYSGLDYSIIAAQIDVAPAGGAIAQTIKLRLAEDGSFTIANLELTSYDIYIKTYAHLRTKVTVDTAVNADLGTVTLISGDLDGGNDVNSTDLASLLANMDLAGN